MTVTATVLPSCSLQAGTMAFGIIDPAAPQSAAQAALTLECTPGTAFAVTMDRGQNDGATGARRMAGVSTGAFIDYEIYRDADLTQPWGATEAAGVSGIAPDAGKVSLAAYGVVVSSSAAPGQYHDTVTVTVQF